MTTISLLVIVTKLTSQVYAQVPCEYGSVALTIDSGNAEAAVENDGHLFWAHGTSLPHFEVPKGSGINVIFRAKPWIGGLINGEIHFTGPQSGQLYYPGPLDQNGYGLPNCSDYDRIWKVSRSDLREIVESGKLSDDIKHWPSGLGAPTVDGNGIVDDYDPTSGDLPAIVGQESAWWIMNDGGRENVENLWFPQVGLEARVFVAAMPSRPNVEVYYFRYTFTYANSNPLEDAYIGFFMDPDLGDFDTDKFGSASWISTVYVYKKDNFDAKYGANPPALAITLLQGPLVDADGLDNNRNGIIDEPNERLDLTAFVAGNEIHKNRPTFFYNHLQGLCGRSGNPIRVGSGCISATGQPTTYWYSGDPVTGLGWLDDGTYDRAFLISSGPFDWLPGEEQTIAFAIIWARGNDNLESISRVRDIAGYLQNTPEFFAPDVSIGRPAALVASFVGFEPAYPNPADTQAFITYTVTDPTEVTLSLFNITGRQIATVHDSFQSPGKYTEIFDVSSLPTGVYFYRLSIGRLSATRPLTVIH
ncbi:MAG: T9SS type A sorting domain-containing protein [Bacteroidetes bacterium]|nr:T9SS type A sorting domain-containing protein [Bacteroidota bacterium]